MTRELSRRFPATRVLVLSMHESEAYVFEALGRGGASGYPPQGSVAGGGGAGSRGGGGGPR